MDCTDSTFSYLRLNRRHRLTEFQMILFLIKEKEFFDNLKQAQQLIIHEFWNNNENTYHYKGNLKEILTVCKKWEDVAVTRWCARLQSAHKASLQIIHLVVAWCLSGQTADSHLLKQNMKYSDVYNILEFTKKA